MPFMHAFPQAPQFCELVLVSTHLVPQAVWPASQVAMQTPALQTWPAVHAIPHPPQCCGSLFWSTHPMPGQSVLPSVHPAHLRSVHTRPPVHTLPQLPQLFLSFATLTQDCEASQ